MIFSIWCAHKNGVYLSGAKIYLLKEREKKVYIARNGRPLPRCMQHWPRLYIQQGMKSYKW